MSAARIAGLGSGLLVLCAARAWAADARCPPSFAKASGACDERVSSGAQACAYPEGKCSCVRSTPCSGVPMPPGEPRWRCQAARRDGCPNDAPPQGGACAAPGKTCSYGNCGSITYSCDAQKRTWFVSGVTAPPPSMAGGGGVHAPPHPTGRPHFPRSPPSTPPRPRRTRRGKPVLPARPSVARHAARARRRRAAKRCHRCAAASRAARRRVACSSLSKRKAGGQTARARVGSAAPPRAFPAPPRRTGCDGFRPIVTGTK